MKKWIVALIAALVMVTPSLAEAQYSRVTKASVLPYEKTGSMAALNDAVIFDLTGSTWPQVAIQITGTWTATLTVTVSNDGTNYTNPATGSVAMTSNGMTLVQTAGARYVRIQATAFTSGTANVVMRTGEGGGGGGGGAAGSVTINDPTITSQKAAVNASGQLSITCANCSGSGASAVDNSVFTFGTTSGAPAMGVLDNTSPNAATEDRTAALRMSSNRNLYVQLRDSAGNERGLNIDASGNLTANINGTATVANGGTFVVQENGAALTALQLIDNLPNTLGSATAGQSGALGLGAVTTAAPTYTNAQSNALSLQTDGSLRTAVTNTLTVGTHAVTGSGTFTVDSEASSAATLADATANPTAGGIASFNMCFNGTTWDRCRTSATTEATHDGALSIGSTVGVPLMGRASSAAPTAVSATDDAVLGWMTLNGATVNASTAGIPTVGNLQSAATANGNGTVISVNGMATLALTVNCATCSGGTQINFEGSEDGTNFAPLSAVQVGTNTIATSTTTAGVTVWSLNTLGLQSVRARISAYSAGTVTVTGRSINATSLAPVQNVNVVSGSTGNAAAGNTGSAVPTQADYTGINIGGTLRGATGKSVGSEFAQAVAIVDGSGVQITSFGGSGGTASNIGSAVPASGTYAGFNDGTNMQGGRVYDTDSGAGTQYSIGVSLRKIANGGSVEAGTSSDPLRIDPTGTTTQPTNVAQINGVTPLMGSGNTGTGSPRVTIATDQAALAGMGVGATGAAPPANANFIGGIGSGATGGFLVAPTSCDSQAFLDMTTATTTELVALTASRKIYVCYWLAMANGATTMTFKRGTGTNCGTGTTTISNAWELTAQTGFSGGSGLGAIFDNQNAGDALCVTNSAGVNLHILVRYAKY